jgi:hypothetical protein
MLKMKMAEPRSSSSRVEHSTALPSASRTRAAASRPNPAWYQLATAIPDRVRVTTPGDSHEREADRIAAKAMQQTAPERTCAGGCDDACLACKSRRTAAFSRPSSGAEGRSRQGPERSEASSSSGVPLDPAILSSMESRFGHDFRDVRVHTGSRADDLASRFDATALSIGNDIVFATGQFAPDRESGQQLLAHELAHVVQHDRGSGAPRVVARQTRDQTGDYTPPGGQPNRPWPGGVPRENERPLPPQPDEPIPTGLVCGPNVDPQLRAVVAEIRTVFAGYGAELKRTSCAALNRVEAGAFTSWDVLELHMRNWIWQNYQPHCATAGGPPESRCGETVQVAGQCYYGGSPNYVIYGTMCRLCHDHQAPAPEAEAFTESRMARLIRDYKSQARNFIPSLAWARAGYNGWPGGGSPPPGDRAACMPTCGRTGPDQLTWRWCPGHDPAGQC